MKLLKKEDYQIDVWKMGRALEYNDKYDAATFAERTTNPLVRGVLLAEMKENI